MEPRPDVDTYEIFVEWDLNPKDDSINGTLKRLSCCSRSKSQLTNYSGSFGSFTFIIVLSTASLKANSSDSSPTGSCSVTKKT